MEPELETRQATGLAPGELRDAWSVLAGEDRVAGFRLLPKAEAVEFFLGLAPRDQIELILGSPAGERRAWVRLLAPDDCADVIQGAEPDEREALLALLDDGTRKEVTALLAYAEDQAGGLMSTRFARVRPEMTVDEAISYLRRQTREHVEVLYYAYVLDPQQVLLGTVSFRDLFQAPPQTRVRDVMRTTLVTAGEEMDQEAVSRLFAGTNLVAIPVLDRDGRMKGIVTVDDIVEVVQEEATEDIHKVGGMEALDAPYFEVGLGRMMKKRGGWLTVLFLGEMLTATAMGYFEHEIARAVVLALFLPLIISSGGNSGSQASMLIVRAMALGEVRLRDWWRVLVRELQTGIMLGAVLGAIGFVRIVVWETLFHTYGAHHVKIAFTVAVSLLGVVLLGTLSGSMLPFLLRRLRFDPASASAPFVATLVDVTGVIIYFTVAAIVLRGTLL